MPLLRRRLYLLPAGAVARWATPAPMPSATRSVFMGFIDVRGHKGPAAWASEMVGYGCDYPPWGDFTSRTNPRADVAVTTALAWDVGEWLSYSVIRLNIVPLTTVLNEQAGTSRAAAGSSIVGFCRRYASGLLCKMSGFMHPIFLHDMEAPMAAAKHRKVSFQVIHRFLPEEDRFFALAKSERTS